MRRKTPPGPPGKYVCRKKRACDETHYVNKTRYLHARLNNYSFLSVLRSAGGEDSVHSEAWLEMTENMLLAVVDIGQQQERLP